MNALKGQTVLMKILLLSFTHLMGALKEQLTNICLIMHGFLILKLLYLGIRQCTGDANFRLMIKVGSGGFARKQLKQKMVLLAKDVEILPLVNITGEELSTYLLGKLKDSFSE